ncbi:HAD-IA family hydrolase [Asticcacaulis excentricus]|uniref:Phosphoglycolate phosphatase n=1 Tax=Asticcacaulis excentricus (strain ATCC 15261 / DSM 4724 / KCTC 12464 / NCIMB 9791 / VKM B-1370 / CB 48) TaxID=573065 RepID=E8RQ81_ASTEC|nr:HAD-IA family hydrolase [Asticcacaulis excentricus]ADU13183.1 phosphoglycolate phosphatase [Asticcacaulis excentricus CB 48]
MTTLPDLSGFGIAFDLDGTLVETAPDIIGTLNTILAEYDVPPFPYEAARSLVGRGARSLIQRGFAAANVPLSEEAELPMVGRFLDLYRERIDQESHAFAGLEGALDQLRAAGARLAVCTNKPTALSELLLTKLGLIERFGSVRGADSVPLKKPDRGHLKACAVDLGLPLDKMLLIGDSETDYLTAQNAGVPCVLVSFGYCDTPMEAMSPAALIDHFDELPTAIASILR